MRPDFLFAMPSRLSGAARTLDLGGTFDEYNNSPAGQLADARALFADWWMVGEYLVDAMRMYQDESAQQARAEEPTEIGASQ